MIKKLLFFVLFNSVALAAPMSHPKNGATIIVEPLASLSLVNPVGKYSFSPFEMADVLKDREDLDLAVFGEENSDTILITLIGAVKNKGHYHVKENISMIEALQESGGLGRLSSSRFILRRGDVIFRIYVGRSHSVSPVINELLPLILLQDGDILWTSEVTPY